MTHPYRHGRPTLGVLVGWHVYWTPTPYSYLNAIFRGISAAVNDRDCNLLLAYGMGASADPSEPLHPAWPTLDRDGDFTPVGPWNTDGLIVVNPLTSETRSGYIQGLVKAGHPVAFIANGEGDPAIVADNAGGISQALQHLVAHGHQRIAFIAGPVEDAEGDSGDRLRAYQAGAQQLGLSAESALVAYGYHAFEGGYAATQHLLRSGTEFTAVVASNDESAMGAMQALKEAKRRIPEDVAVIGFDDRPEAAAQVPPLTSVHVPLYKLGYQAVEVLLQRLQGQSAPSLKVSTSLALRQSCGCRQGVAGLTQQHPERSASAPSTTTSTSSVSAHAQRAAARSRRARAKAVPVGEANSHPAHIVQTMVEAVLAETQRFEADEVQHLCERLARVFISSIEQGAPTDFQQVVEELLRRVEIQEDDAHIWQAAISSLRRAVPDLIEVAQRPTAQLLALDLLDQARQAISERMRRQHGQYIIDQKWVINRIGSLTARLLMTSEESQIFEVLANALPAMGIAHTSLAFFEAQGDDPVAWSVLHTIPDDNRPPMRFPTRQFPPEGLYPSDQAFSLMLLPLVNPSGLTGFIAYDSINIELDGPITQQIAAALNNARLYREATEGRILAEEANRLKSGFLSTVSHELRTPLNLIAGLSEVLLQKRDLSQFALPAPYQKDIEQIYASAQHLGRLIRDVLDLASSQVGQLRLANELFDVTETLEMVIATGRQLATDKGLTWHDTIPPTKLWVWGDRTRFRQVALNLVSNAVKFTEQGTITLEVKRIDDFRLLIADFAPQQSAISNRQSAILVSVSDTGLGIAPAEQTLIFDEFRRSEVTTARGYGGLGLGLAICKRLVEMHGGEIGVRSSGEEGAGSTFYFTLPLIEPEAIHGEEQLLSLGLEQTVLLLTNQSGSGERLRDHLIQKGYEVKMIQIDPSSDRLPPLLAMPLGAVVLDMSIAPTLGWNMLKLLKENPATRAVPLVFYALSEDQGAMLELDYLTKPVGMAELSRALEYQKLTAYESKTEKVFLIVDDDPATLEMHVRIVQSQLGAHRVLKARNGREALELMQAQRPDLVLLDLMMPELDGFGVLEAMRQTDSTRDIPVIVLTGQMLTEKEMARLNRGVATVLGKGLFSVEETLNHIEVALARKRKLGSEAQRLVRQAMAYVHEHYTEPISREDLAQHLGLSSNYLTHCFRAEVGMTPITYLNRYRVNRAKVLLAKSDKTMLEIARAVGFSDSGYFSRVFRRQVGVSPDAYRRT